MTDDGDAFRTAYFLSLGIDKDKPNRNALKAALNRAHDLRKFEIENYWKRATYAWAFQVAALGSLAIVLGEPGNGLEKIAPIAAFGGLSALAAALTAKGSKFWQENWEAHVDMLEGDIEGRITQTIMVRGPAFSVSRINERFLWILCAAWAAGFVLVASAIWGLPPLLTPKLTIAMETIAVGAAILALLTTGSRLAGRRLPRRSISRISFAGRAGDHILQRDTMAGNAKNADRLLGQPPTARTGSNRYSARFP